MVFAGVYGVGKTSLFKRMFKLGFSKEKMIIRESKRTHKEILEDDETIIPVRLKSTILYVV